MNSTESKAAQPVPALERAHRPDCPAQFYAVSPPHCDCQFPDEGWMRAELREAQKTEVAAFMRGDEAVAPEQGWFEQGWLTKGVRGVAERLLPMRRVLRLISAHAALLRAMASPDGYVDGALAEEGWETLAKEAEAALAGLGELSARAAGASPVKSKDSANRGGEPSSPRQEKAAGTVGKSKPEPPREGSTVSAAVASGSVADLRRCGRCGAEWRGVCGDSCAECGAAQCECDACRASALAARPSVVEAEEHGDACDVGHLSSGVSIAEVERLREALAEATRQKEEWRRHAGRAEADCAKLRAAEYTARQERDVARAKLENAYGDRDVARLQREEALAEAARRQTVFGELISRTVFQLSILAQAPGSSCKAGDNVGEWAAQEIRQLRTEVRTLRERVAHEAFPGGKAGR